jgi:hypothetical protein
LVSEERNSHLVKCHTNLRKAYTFDLAGR